MNDEVARELKKIAASLALIEHRLASIQAERGREAEMQTDFPPMPFPAFEHSPSSLPI